MPKPLWTPVIDVFIGYDGKESLAYHVLAHSIMRRSSMPVRITPIRKSTLGNLYTRDDPQASTEFSLTRFLVPYLMDYDGWGIFMDCDMLMCDDIAKLWRLRDDAKTVMCVKHAEYKSSARTKMNGLPQTAYPRKNWSSLMMFNSRMCRGLTPRTVDQQTPAYLHRMTWAGREEHIGPLPPAWNVLVGEQGLQEDPKLLHWTLGGPWWHAYTDAPYADLWRAEFESLVNENGGSDATAASILNAAREQNGKNARATASYA